MINLEFYELTRCWEDRVQYSRPVLAQAASASEPPTELDLEPASPIHARLYDDQGHWSLERREKEQRELAEHFGDDSIVHRTPTKPRAYTSAESP